MDELIRLAAFNWLEKQTSMHGDVLSRGLLENGFIHESQKVTLIGAKGIWRPKCMEYPLSITTVVNGPYQDLSDGSVLKYKYRGNNPHHSDNVGLRSMISLQIPLIYFFGMVTGRYLVTWPVYIIADNPYKLEFTVAVDDAKLIGEQTNKAAEEVANYRRTYLTSTILTRIHQRSFRERVLRAYRSQCALCKLRHVELLDAAHIISDREEAGDPIISNGLALCKIHHAAFDKNFIGINPDYQIIVREDILHETDGPMLRHGIQLLNKSSLILPAHKKDWPDRERLGIRYQQFLNAS